MKSRYLCAGIAGWLTLCSVAAWAEDKATGCNNANLPLNIDGQVVKVDMEAGRLTLRASDGTLHEFQATKETLADYKAGDPIKAKLSSTPKCD